jgi:hypothetical protein
VIAEIDEGRSSNRDQHVGAKTRAALPVLPLDPDQGSEHERDREADQCVQEIMELKSLDELHGAPRVAVRKSASSLPRALHADF